MITSYIDRNNDRYPELLKQISDPPEGLYTRGDTTLLNTRCFAVVGSRKASRAGLLAAEMIGKRLAECGITVVSGLAEGIDSAAHKGALSAGGATIAVLANGLDIVYPAVNREIQKEIAQKGLLISEYPDGTAAQRFCFPLRNRIISGISETVIVAEAALRSGSLITAEAAAEQGRRVFAVPGNFMLDCCAGTNHLITDGAEELIDVNLFLEDMGLNAAVEKEISDLSEDERKVLSIIRRRGETTTDEIIMETLMPAGAVNGIITVLEIKGLVSMEMGKVFPRVGAL